MIERRSAGITLRPPGMPDPWPVLLVFLGAHAALAPVMSQSSTVATLHAVATMLVGIWVAVQRRFEQVMYVAAYIAGAEVLWRLTGAGVFWEFGKYCVAMVFIVAALRLRRLSRWQLLPLLYLLLLIPSALLIDSGISFDQARQQISFNLSGPLALAATAFVAGQMTLSRMHLQRQVGSGC